MRKVGGVVAATACACPSVLRLLHPPWVSEELIELTMAVAFVGLMLVLVTPRRGVLGAFWPALGAAFVGTLLPAWLLGWTLVPPEGRYRSADAPPGWERMDLQASRVAFGDGGRAKSGDLHPLWDRTPGAFFMDFAKEGYGTICFDDCDPAFTLSRAWPFSSRVKLVEWRDGTRVVTYEPASP
ncbi:MAG: hypothetical protein U0229_02425 [Anaeromyxobacter sp.]